MPVCVVQLQFPLICKPKPKSTSGQQDILKAVLKRPFSSYWQFLFKYGPSGNPRDILGYLTVRFFLIYRRPLGIGPFLSVVLILRSDSELTLFSGFCTPCSLILVVTDICQ